MRCCSAIFIVGSGLGPRLVLGVFGLEHVAPAGIARERGVGTERQGAGHEFHGRRFVRAVRHVGGEIMPRDHRDRKSVVEGKSVSVRVELGGPRIIKNKQAATYAITEEHKRTKTHTKV